MHYSKENGENIDNWNIEELKEVVAQYIEKNPLHPPGSTDEESAQPNTDDLVVILYNVQIIPSPITNAQVPIMQNTPEEIKTASLVPSEFATEHFSIKITK